MEKDANVFHVCSARCLTPLFTRLRDVATPPDAFRRYSRRLMRVLAEEGIACLNGAETRVQTATGASIDGLLIEEDGACVVSIIRGGDSLLEAVLECSPDLPVGKILIQRDEASEGKAPKLYYSKLPPCIGTKQILLCDPMLATGGSAVMAIEELVRCGAEEARIIFLNVIAAPEGIQRLKEAFPQVRIVTACIDDGLNDNKYIVPGLGDWGDRFYGTTT